MDRCDPAILATDTLIYRNVLARLVDAGTLPVDLTAMADDVLAALREYDEAAPELPEIAWLMELAERFRAAARAWTREELARQCRPKRAGASRRAPSDPVLYHASTDFDYDLGRASRMLPGLAPCLTLSALATEESLMARTLLRRRANRIAHGLICAEKIIVGALAPPQRRRFDMVQRRELLAGGMAAASLHSRARVSPNRAANASSAERKRPARGRG